MQMFELKQKLFATSNQRAALNQISYYILRKQKLMCGAL